MSFPRYPTYKASGVEWLGEVPAHWEVAPTKRQFQVVGGGTPASDDESCWDGELPWATPADLGKRPTFELATTHRLITDKGLASSNAVMVPAGSVVLSTRAPIGSVGIAVRPLCTNQGCKSLVSRGDAWSKYFAFVFASCTPSLQLRGKGTTFLELSADELEAFRIPVPTPSEQRAIAAFLDRETAKIDALIAEQEKLIALLAEKRQAVISHAVTKGLNPNAPMKPSGVEWLGEVPAHWEVVPLRHLIDCLDGIRVPLNAEQRAERPGSIPYWGANCIVDHVDAALVAEPVVLLGEDGAPFFDETKPVAFFIEEPIWPNNHVHVLRPRKGISGKHLAAVLNITEYAHFIDGSTRDKLTQAAMRSIPVTLPPIEEQVRIGAHIDEANSRLASLEADCESAITLLRERRAALISAAVTGQIDVRHLAPESAA